MRYLAGVLLLMVAWPLLLAFDFLSFFVLLPLLNGGCVGVEAGIRLTELVFD